MNPAGGRVEVLEEVIEVPHDNANELKDGRSPKQQGPAKQHPGKIHCLLKCSTKKGKGGEQRERETARGKRHEKERDLEAHAEHEADDRITIHLGPEVDNAEDQGARDGGDSKAQANGLFKKKSKKTKTKKKKTRFEKSVQFAEQVRRQADREDGPAEENEEHIVRLPALKEPGLQRLGVIVEEVEIHEERKAQSPSKQERPREPPDLQERRRVEGKHKREDEEEEEEERTSNLVKTAWSRKRCWTGIRPKFAPRVTPRVPRNSIRVTRGIPLRNSPMSFDAMRGWGGVCWVVLAGEGKEESEKEIQG